MSFFQTVTPRSTFSSSGTLKHCIKTQCFRGNDGWKSVGRSVRKRMAGYSTFPDQRCPLFGARSRQLVLVLLALHHFVETLSVPRNRAKILVQPNDYVLLSRRFRELLEPTQRDDDQCRSGISPPDVPDCHLGKSRPSVDRARESSDLPEVKKIRDLGGGIDFVCGCFY